jgi:hypothetical protein
VQKTPLPSLGADAATLRQTPTEYPSFSGGRVAVGWWCDPHQVIGFEASGMVLQSRSFASSFALNDAAGTALGVSSSLRFWGSEADLLLNLYRGPSLTLGLLGGFRYLDLRENLQVARGPTLNLYRTRNHFYGAEGGAQVEYRWDRLFLQLTGKLSLGGTTEAVDVAGRGPLALAPVAATPGGLFVLPGSAGHFTANTFTAVPEADVRLGYHFSQRLTAFVAYNVLYWSHAVRPGNQINPNLPQAISPSAFWGQGIAFGVEVGF